MKESSLVEIARSALLGRNSFSNRRGLMGRLVLLQVLFLTLLVLASSPVAARAQGKCGAEGQRPCKVWERIPSCNKGLYEDFRLNMCVRSNTQVDANTGKYIPRKRMTYVNLCNRSSQPRISSALAQWVSPEEGWVSFGWYTIPAGKCQKVEIEYEYTGSLYIYGSAQNGTTWDGTDAKFCVKTYDSFNIDNADRLQCQSSEYSIVGMNKFDVKPGANNWNFGN